MIQYLLSITEKIKAKEFCNKILDNNVTHQYIEENTGCLTDIMYKIMPKDYEHSNLLMEYSILVDDILEMKSISQYEKDKAIANLILVSMDEFTNIAKDILAKINLDEEEASKNAYCPKLMKQ